MVEMINIIATTISNSNSENPSWRIIIHSELQRGFQLCYDLRPKSYDLSKGAFNQFRNVLIRFHASSCASWRYSAREGPCTKPWRTAGYSTTVTCLPAAFN